MIRRLLALKWRLLPLAAAALILCLPLADSQWHKHQVSKATQAAQSKIASAKPVVKLEGTPNRILIPSLNIDLPVVPQTYSPAIKSWPVAIDTANYATETPPANNTKGQSLIYGHDTSGVFGPLLNMQMGAEAFVYTANGHIFKYSYNGSKDVSPRQVDIVADMAKAPAGLNLITCTGDNFQYRRVMTFKLIKAA